MGLLKCLTFVDKLINQAAVNNVGQVSNTTRLNVVIHNYIELQSSRYYPYIHIYNRISPTRTPLCNLVA